MIFMWHIAPDGHFERENYTYQKRRQRSAATLKPKFGSRA